VWIDVGGPSAPGKVLRKREDIQISSDGDWNRRWLLDIDFPPSTSGLNPTVTVDSARFVRMRAGDPVTLHYLSCCPIFARLSDRSTVTVLGEFAMLALPTLRWAIWAVAGLAAVFFASRVGRIAVLGAAGLWVGAGLALDAVVPDAPPYRPGSLTAVATVRDVRRVEELLRSRGDEDWDYELPVPYDVAALAFVPAGAADSVVAVDVVDAESVDSLTPGRHRTVRYDPRAPREARLAGGTRDYVVENRPFILRVLGIFVAVITGLGLLAAWKPRGRRRGRS
jgi:hypothetical protein